MKNIVEISLGCGFDSHHLHHDKHYRSERLITKKMDKTLCGFFANPKAVLSFGDLKKVELLSWLQKLKSFGSKISRENFKERPEKEKASQLGSGKRPSPKIKFRTETPIGSLSERGNQ